jgi:hypothetical protein
MMHKFLATGALGPLSGFAWPVPAGGAPGAWVEVDGPLELCARGVHVCRTFDLAHWIHDELWEVEAAGDQVDGVDCIVVRRARLVRRIDAWSGPGGRRFAEACVEHATAQAGPAPTVMAPSLPADGVRDLLDDAQFMATHGYVALAAFTAAVAVSRLGAEVSPDGAYRRERGWQSAWIVRHLLAAHPS